MNAQEIVRLERLRVTTEINNLLAAAAKMECGWYAKDWLTKVRDEIVNKLNGT